eukprot:1637188-Pyramimonas_sp.AAC.2
MPEMPSGSDRRWRHPKRFYPLKPYTWIGGTCHYFGADESESSEKLPCIYTFSIRSQVTFGPVYTVFNTMPKMEGKKMTEEKNQK